MGENGYNIDQKHYDSRQKEGNIKQNESSMDWSRPENIRES